MSSGKNISPCLLIAPSKVIQDIGIGSGLLVLDSGFFVSGTWILHSNHQWDSGFQSPRFWIPQEFFSWIPDSTGKNFQIPLHCCWGSIWESRCSYAGVISSHGMPFRDICTRLHVSLCTVRPVYTCFIPWKPWFFPSPFELLGTWSRQGLCITPH